MRFHIFPLVISLLLLPALIFSSIDLDEFQIKVSPDKQSTFVYSNKKAAFWYGEVSRQNLKAYQGLTILEQRYLRDYSLFIGEEKVPRKIMQQARLYPDRLVRDYSPMTETHYFVDGLNGLLLRIETEEILNLGFSPILDGLLEKSAWEWVPAGSYARCQLSGVASEKPGFMGVLAWGEGVVSNAEFKELTVKIPRRQAESRQSLARVTASGAKQLFFAVIIAEDSLSLALKADSLKNFTSQMAGKRASRLTTLLNSNKIETADTAFNKAIRWAQIAVDNLVVKQKGAGIWAGLPWFNNYWGRDTFISLPGALLATGQFEAAKAVLWNFANYQETNRNSPDYGRLPNRIMLNETIYNTADGTPWFVRACDQYVRYTGDKDFIGEMFPVIHRAMEGAEKYRVDEYGFLFHDDADTWMDAVGTEGPWSPRGNRAVEIQALWMEQTRTSTEWANYLGEVSQSEKWSILQKRLRANFLRQFWQVGSRSLADHISLRGFPDTQIRPNSIFAITLPQPAILDSTQEKAVLEKLVQSLVFPWGVASLAQDDVNFHPYHHYPPYYVPDAAYHNGLIWTWLSGPFVSALSSSRPDLAASLLKSTAGQILHKNAIGNQSELLEAWPRTEVEEPRVSGAISQAWNLAEFLRNTQQDLVGLRPELENSTIHWQPMVEVPGLLPINFRQNIGRDLISGMIDATPGKYLLTISRDPSPTNLDFVISLPTGNRIHRFKVDCQGGKPLSIEMDRASKQILINGIKQQEISVSAKLNLNRIDFATPAMNNSLPALSKPLHYLVPAAEATATKGRLTSLLFDIADPSGDDRGPENRYSYPTNTNFQPGIFDLRRARIWRDDDYLFFEIKYDELVDPGWRAEPGFQLTYTAITLSFEKMKTVRRTRVEMNANYAVPSEYSYNFVIFVGNGYRLMDARGRILAEYLPADENGQIGFVDDKAIRFSIPLKLLSERQLRNAAVLSGGQDDHGGGGVGEFRDVLREVGEWHGGGAESPRSSNVYDVMFIRR